MRLLTERRDEGWIEPLDTVIRLGGKIPVVQCDHLSALVASVARLLGVFMAVPIQGEHRLWDGSGNRQMTVPLSVRAGEPRAWPLMDATPNTQTLTNSAW